MPNTEVRQSVLGGRKMTEEELAEYLQSICYGTVSYVDDEGWPQMRPMNFSYLDGKFYFHANKTQGEKLRGLREGARVCLSFYTPSDRVGKEYLCRHQSVLVYGCLRRLDGEGEENKEEILRSMTALCQAAGTPYKAEPERLGKAWRSISVFRVDPEAVVGKWVHFGSLPR